MRETLFDGEQIEALQRRERMQGALDAIARRYGKKVVGVAASRLTDDWRMKRDLLSPCCTTRWEDILKVG